MHRFDVTVHYEDTDLSGFVYHANYLKFIERARSDWVRALGVDQTALRAAGHVFVVTRIDARFLAPAALDNSLTIHTKPLSATPARLTLHQAVHRADTPLFEAQVTLACMTLRGRPTRLPAEIRRAAQTPENPA